MRNEKTPEIVRLSREISFKKARNSPLFHFHPRHHCVEVMSGRPAVGRTHCKTKWPLSSDVREKGTDSRMAAGEMGRGTAHSLGARGGFGIKMRLFEFQHLESE